MTGAVAPGLVDPSGAAGGRLRFLALVALAAVGTALLVIVAVNRWTVPSDEAAYWRAAQRLAAGAPLYDASLPVGTPYVYLYPPPLAQVLAPFTGLLPEAAWMWAWTGLLLACVAYLGLGRPLVALAVVAFLPVAVELWYRNAHLVLAVLAVLALRRSPLWWVPATALKLTPVLGLVFLLARGRYRDAVLTGLVGMAVVAVSVLISPGAWRDYAAFLAGQAGGVGVSLVPVPFPVRLLAALVLAAVGGRVAGWRGEALLVAGLVLGNPSLALNAVSMLAAILPLWWTSSERRQAPAPSGQGGPQPAVPTSPA